MRFDLHITRKDKWDKTGDEIAENEWLELAEEDPELDVLDLEDEKYPEAETRVVEWNAHPAKKIIPFFYRAGNIETTGPDRYTIGKMQKIAEELGGQIQEEDGEVY